jgi:hypothetical protein
MARSLRAVVAIALLTFVAASVAAVPAVADAASGVAYLASTQDADGGWDGPPGGEFTTSEAILAIAAAAQTSSGWSETEAFDAVDQFEHVDPPNNSPLDYMAATATAETTLPSTLPPGKAAKWIVNVAVPLGLDPTDFLSTGVDLVAIMGVPGADGSFGTGFNFNGAAYAALASYLLNGSVPSQTVTYLLDAQTPSGGWSFDGNPASDPETDSTALTLEALIAGGTSPTDPVVQSALTFLARDVTPEAFDLDAGYDNATGIWWAFGGESPEGTSRALLGIAALGYDPSTPCWRDTARPELAGTAYTPPMDALVGMQEPDGSWGVPPFNAFSTAQAVQGLEVSTWRPIVVGAAQTCEVPPVPPAPTPVADAIVLVPTFTG